MILCGAEDGRQDYNMNVFDEKKKKRDVIICVDSDGCVMDTMNIKHIRCFGPCMVDEWNLDKWRDEILERWNVINLFSETRGINRFKGLAMMLSEVSEKYTEIAGIKALKTWSEDSPELSNDSCEKMLKVDPIFQKALNWSRKVNEEIAKLPAEEIKPFDGAKDALDKAHELFDIAVVSSANPEAVNEEWERFDLVKNVDILCTQDVGSKAYCISRLLDMGYNYDHILMCGDAPGDEKAAEDNGVLFFPILVGKEKESWKELSEAGTKRFSEGTFAGEYQDKLKKMFHENLS